MAAPREHEVEEIDPRDIEHQTVGSPLRDAAVDPQAGDFLPPTNAGEANPHGPLVVAPGIHASETGPIAPGPVSKDVREQEAKETALAEAVFVENQDVPTATAAADDTPGRRDEKAAEAAPEDSRPAEVEGEPEGASARASDGTSDTTSPTRAVAKKSTAKASSAKSEATTGDGPAATK